jgi:serine/threonine-protein kinase
MDRIGRYEILQELGRGAMGAVYRARDPQIGRTVAIKVILTANLSPTELENYKQRFRREAQAAGQMSHAGIVTIHDIAEDETGQPFLVMEFIEGQTLDKLMEQAVAAGERLPHSQALDIAFQVANALDYAHRRGVVHRDVKPANILVTADGTAKIADFGIAKIAGTQLTQTGNVLGTPAFMSPEQFSGAAIDARSDLFSLGAMIYWMCTGEKPFAGDTLTAVSFKIVFADPIPARQLNPALPAGIDTVFQRCLAKNPELRYAACRELAADLDALRSGRQIAATPIPIGEATVMQPAQVLAATPVIAPLEKTQAVPAAPPPAPMERTVATPATSAAEEKTALLPRRPPTAAPAEPGKKPKLALIAVAALLLLGAALGGYYYFSQPETATVESPAPAAPPKSTPSQAASLPSQPAAEPVRVPEPPPEERAAEPAPRGKAKGRQKRSSTTFAGPLATLKLDCQHNFRSASLEIFSGDRLVYQTTLRGQDQGFGGVKIYQGRLQTSTEIPAGQHVLRVRVSGGGYEAEEEIGGGFSEGGTKTLLIEFGKGSAFGVIERKLSLRWFIPR